MKSFATICNHKTSGCNYMQPYAIIQKNEEVFNRMQKYSNVCKSIQMYAKLQSSPKTWLIGNWKNDIIQSLLIWTNGLPYDRSVKFEKFQIKTNNFTIIYIFNIFVSWIFLRKVKKLSKNEAQERYNTTKTLTWTKCWYVLLLIV